MSLLHSKAILLPRPGCYQGCQDTPAVRWVHVLQQYRMLGPCGRVYQPAAARHAQSHHHDNLGAEPDDTLQDCYPQPSLVRPVARCAGQCASLSTTLDCCSGCRRTSLPSSVRSSGQAAKACRLEKSCRRRLQVNSCGVDSCLALQPVEGATG